MALITKEGLINKLKDSSSVPTEEEFFLLQEEVRPPTEFRFKQSGPFKDSSVLILLFEHNGTIFFPLIKRTSRDSDRHSGQVSLPGGKRDSDDKDDWSAAIREADEEISAKPYQISYLTELHDIPVPASGFMIHPFIGWYEGPSQFRPNPEEVQSLFFIDIELVAKPNVIKKTDMTVRGFDFKDVPYFDIGDQVVWGATAAVLAELRWRILKN